MPRPPHRTRSQNTPAEDRVFGKRATRFLRLPDRTRTAPTPPRRNNGVIECQLLHSYLRPDGRFSVFALDVADTTGTQFLLVLGAEFAAYIAEYHLNKNPRDLQNPHVPLAVHYACIVDLDNSTLTRGRWLGNYLAQAGFELTKVILDE